MQMRHQIFRILSPVWLCSFGTDVAHRVKEHATYSQPGSALQARLQLSLQMTPSPGFSVAPGT